jgi:hypothetical protein
MKLATDDLVSESKNESVFISTVFVYRHGVVLRAGDFTFIVTRRVSPLLSFIHS